MLSRIKSVGLFKGVVFICIFSLLFASCASVGVTKKNEQEQLRSTSTGWEKVRTWDETTFYETTLSAPLSLTIDWLAYPFSKKVREKSTQPWEI